MAILDKDYIFSRDSVALACARARDAVVSNFSSYFNEWGITEQQWRVIRILHDEKILSLSDLCNYSCIHKASMTRIISHLISKGWVEKQKDLIDTRSFNVTLTEEGNNFVIEAKKISGQIYQEIYDKYGIQKMKLLIEMLQDLEVVRK